MADIIANMAIDLEKEILDHIAERRENAITPSFPYPIHIRGAHITVLFKNGAYYIHDNRVDIDV